MDSVNKVNSFYKKKRRNVVHHTHSHVRAKRLQEENARLLNEKQQTEEERTFIKKNIHVPTFWNLLEFITKGLVTKEKNEELTLQYLHDFLEKTNRVRFMPRMQHLAALMVSIDEFLILYNIIDSDSIQKEVEIVTYKDTISVFYPSTSSKEIDTEVEEIIMKKHRKKSRKHVLTNRRSKKKAVTTENWRAAYSVFKPPVNEIPIQPSVQVQPTHVSSESEMDVEVIEDISFFEIISYMTASSLTVQHPFTILLLKEYIKLKIVVKKIGFYWCIKDDIGMLTLYMDLKELKYSLLNYSQIRRRFFPNSTLTFEDGQVSTVTNVNFEEIQTYNQDEFFLLNESYATKLTRIGQCIEYILYKKIDDEKTDERWISLDGALAFITEQHDLKKNLYIEEKYEFITSIVDECISNKYDWNLDGKTIDDHIIVIFDENVSISAFINKDFGDEEIPFNQVYIDVYAFCCIEVYVSRYLGIKENVVEQNMYLLFPFKDVYKVHLLRWFNHLEALKIKLSILEVIPNEIEDDEVVLTSLYDSMTPLNFPDSEALQIRIINPSMVKDTKVLIYNTEFFKTLVIDIKERPYLAFTLFQSKIENDRFIFQYNEALIYKLQHTLKNNKMIINEGIIPCLLDKNDPPMIWNMKKDAHKYTYMLIHNTEEQLQLEVITTTKKKSGKDEEDNSMILEEPRTRKQKADKNENELKNLVDAGYKIPFPLPNITGVSCFAASMLQALFIKPDKFNMDAHYFRHEIDDSKKCSICSFVDLRRKVNVKSMLSKFTRICQKDVIITQQDVTHAYDILINKMQEDIQKFEEDKVSLFNRCFTTNIKTDWTCRQCHHIQPAPDNYVNYIALPVIYITEKDVKDSGNLIPLPDVTFTTLEQCLYYFCGLKNTNPIKKRCNNCNSLFGYGRSTIQDSESIILSLKLFRTIQDKNGVITTSLLKTDVKPVMRIDMHEFIGLPLFYNLYAIICYQAATQYTGAKSSGHYIAYIKIGVNWFLCNDAYIKKVEEEFVATQMPYMLFYSKENI